MPTFRVKPNQILPHAGQELAAGTIVELPRFVGQEFPQLVEEVDTNGQVVAPQDPWTLEAARYQQHERRQILERHLEAEQRRLDDAQAIAHRSEQDTAAAQQAAQAVGDGIARITASIANLDRAVLMGDNASTTPPAPTPAPEASKPAPGKKTAEKTADKAESSS